MGGRQGSSRWRRRMVAPSPRVASQARWRVRFAPEVACCVGSVTGVGIPHLAIVGGRDRLVTTASALAVRDAEVEVYDHLGHNALLYNPAVHGRVVRALDEMTLNQR